MGVTRHILAADIGGTNSRFAHFTAEEGGELELLDTVWLKTGEASSLGELMASFRESGFSLRPEDAEIAALAVAGPVSRKAYSAPPYISWDIDLSRPGDFGLRRAVLVNDFVAQAHACLTRPGLSAEGILPGEPEEGAATAIIGAGTGLGMAAIVPDGHGGYVPLPSEGGHSSFPFVGRRECEYQEFVLKDLGAAYLTGNDVVSGRGLSYVHRFLTGEDLSPAEVAGAFDAHPETLSWAARFYGRACRNFALNAFALGGLYIAGGVAARTPALVRHAAFKDEFRSSPKHGALLARIPVSLITDEQSGLWGAAFMGLLELARGELR